MKSQIIHMKQVLKKPFLTFNLDISKPLLKI